MPKRKILVVDDAVDYTRLVKLSLEATAEFEVMIESDPDKAMALARTFHPDIILLDYIMPTMTGGDFMDMVREDPALKATPVIFLTASIIPDSVDGITTLLGSPCLIKPAPVDDIVDAIDHALSAP